ncbi:hypothetical protein B0H14DRAFT_3157744 [Mycena olivaceomarginata]|nr:hypothetical protein B0H14DRAFT_3157744 [Mycena olivaceomarginata]
MGKENGMASYLWEDTSICEKGYPVLPDKILGSRQQWGTILNLYLHDGAASSYPGPRGKYLRLDEPRHGSPDSEAGVLEIYWRSTLTVTSLRWRCVNLILSFQSSQNPVICTHTGEDDRGGRVESAGSEEMTGEHDREDRVESAGSEEMPRTTWALAADSKDHPRAAMALVAHRRAVPPHDVRSGSSRPPPILPTSDPSTRNVEAPMRRAVRTFLHVVPRDAVRRLKDKWGKGRRAEEKELVAGGRVSHGLCGRNSPSLLLRFPVMKGGKSDLQAI